MSAVIERNLEQELNDHLAQWHLWSAGYRYAGGFSAICASCPSPRSRTGEEGDVDERACEAIDAAIDDMHPDHRLALRVLARNLAVHAQVWTSERLPATAAERAVLTMEARNDLARRLIARGVL